MPNDMKNVPHALTGTFLNDAAKLEHLRRKKLFSKLLDRKARIFRKYLCNLRLPVKYCFTKPFSNAICSEEYAVNIFPKKPSVNNE